MPTFKANFKYRRALGWVPSDPRKHREQADFSTEKEALNLRCLKKKKIQKDFGAPSHILDEGATHWAPFSSVVSLNFPRTQEVRNTSFLDISKKGWTSW